MKKTKVDLMITPDRGASERITWYPGHMVKATRQIREKLKMVDLIVEVRDARAIIQSSNEELLQIAHNKNYLTVINKTDLVSKEELSAIKSYLETNKMSYIMLNKESFDQSVFIKKALSLVTKDKKIRMIIIGMPNTGKSTLINLIAHRKSTRTGNRPGLTRSQQWVKVNTQMELLDSPGIMVPRIEDPERGKVLSAINAIPDKIMGKDNIALFILSALGFNDPLARLDEIAKERGALLKGAITDYERVYTIIINEFASGKLGYVSFNKFN